VETIRISDELNVDMTPDGKIYGIEMLNANQQLMEQDGGNFILVNEAFGQQKNIPFK